jgi:hypothetical protein
MINRIKSISICFSSVLLIPCFAHALRIHGKITDAVGKPLAFASVTIRGTTVGTSANKSGEYSLDLGAGSYMLECRHVGYRKQERSVRLEDRDLRIDFSMVIEELNMSAIVIRNGVEDPAYAIMREAIRSRPAFREQVKGYSCDAYVKGLLRLDSFPDKFMGQKVDFEDGDTGRQRILFLSETMARLDVQPPDRQHVRVLSTRVSGASDAYGLADPRVISFYENLVDISSALNPGGFVSPVADNAFRYYRFRYRGAFFEDGRQITRIEVIPKRAFDPVFQGFIQIVDGEWAIHSLELYIGKDAQLALLDKLVISQLYMPLQGGVWMLQNQSIIPSVRKFGFQAGGYFSAVFSRYTIEPGFHKNTFGRVILRYDTASNRRPRQWWDSIRPVPLMPDELRDFWRKDSLERARKEPAYLDSLDSIRNRVTPTSIFLTGQTFFKRSKNLTIQTAPLIKYAGFNTVEGAFLRLTGTVNREMTGSRSLSFTPSLRYGFGNRQFNPHLSTIFRPGGKANPRWTVAAGRNVFQFNGANPISQLANTSNTLLFGNNHMKLYQAVYTTFSHTREIAPGLSLTAAVRYQDRTPLENTDTTTFWGRRSENMRFTPNRAAEWSPYNITRHQALQASLSLRFRPGAQFIEFPDRREEISSGYPIISFDYIRGINGVLGSDVHYDRWKLSVSDDVAFGRAGRFRYNAYVGGFGFSRQVQLPDLQHFNGNQILSAQTYLNTFQLAPYYALSQDRGSYAVLHLQHELLGAVTNRIPLVRRLDLQMLGGANILYRSPSDRYAEVFVGVDKILKTIRLDWVWSWEQNRPSSTGIRFGIQIVNAILADD